MNKDRAIEIFKNIRNDDNILHFTHEEHLQAIDYAIEQMQQRYQMNDKGEVTPVGNEERPQAKWEEVHNGCKTYYCSNCGNVRFSNYHNYCEECGAKMLVEPYVRSEE